MDTKKKPRGRHSPTAKVRTEAGASYPQFYCTTDRALVKKPAHKQYRRLTYSRRSTWAILGPMIDTARALGLGDLVDDLLELGRSWQRRGVAA